MSRPANVPPGRLRRRYPGSRGIVVGRREVQECSRQSRGHTTQVTAVATRDKCPLDYRSEARRW